MSEGQERHDQSRSGIDTARLVLAGVVAIALVAFVIDNRDDTRVGYIFGDTEAPMIVVLILAALAGALIAVLVAGILRRRR